MDTLPSTLRAIIADDEPLARKLLIRYLQAFPYIEVVAECENGLIALNRIHALQPDLVFLDIQMPELDGLSLLRELQNLPLVIFTTAFNQYAIQAFELNAVDYLLKPFDQERFEQAIHKVLARQTSPALIGQQIIGMQRSLDALLKSEKQYTRRILIKGKEGYSFLNVQDIYWFEAFGDYVKIHSSDKYYLKHISLQELESKLDPRLFTRIHRSTIVQIDCIRELKPYVNGEYYLILSNDTRLKLSRSYREQLRQIIDESI